MMNIKEYLSTIDLVILCGGLGTRLATISGGNPKALVDIHGTPFLDFLVKFYRDQGFKRIIFCCGYQSQKIKEKYKSDESIEYIFSTEVKQLGTGGAIKNAQHLIKSRKYFVVNGDSFININFKKMVDFDKEKKSKITLALCELENYKDGGVIKLNDNLEVISFHEKPKNLLNDHLISAGIYFIEKSYLNLSYSSPFSLEIDVFQNIHDKKIIFGYKEQGEKVIDIGTPERYYKSLDLLKKYL